MTQEQFEKLFKVLNSTKEGIWYIVLCLIAILVAMQCN